MENMEEALIGWEFYFSGIEYYSEYYVLPFNLLDKIVVANSTY